MKQEDLIKFSKELKINFDDEDLKIFSQIYKNFDKKIKILNSINTKNIKPMLHIEETCINFNDLREDEKVEIFSKEKLLKNAPNFDQDYIIVNNGKYNDKK